MDHQEILPKRKRVDTIAQVADESQENPQNEGLPNINVNHEWEEAQFGIPLQLSDDADSEVLFKKQVPIALDACPTETLRRFCNRSFRFMDAYRKGLSVKAAAWCVKKQKGHRAISEAVMKEFDAQEEGGRSIPTKL